MSLLDLSLLGLLADRPQHGYELSKQLRALGRGAVSYGALYPALARLDRKGLITSTSSPDRPLGDDSPMTGSLGAEVARLRRGSGGVTERPKRKRKVYTITDPGRQRLHELLTAPAEDDRTLTAQLAAASHLGHTERLELFMHRRRMLRERLGADTPGPGDRYRRALRERDRLADEAEVSWLDHLISAERDDATAAPESPFSADISVGVDTPVGVAVDAVPPTVGGSIP